MKRLVIQHQKLVVMASGVMGLLILVWIMKLEPKVDVPVNHHIDQASLFGAIRHTSLPGHSHVLENTDTFRQFFVVWTTSPSTWTHLHWLALQSIFIHHPDCTLYLLSDQFTNFPQFFAPLEERGYNIAIVPTSPEWLLQNDWFVGPVSKQWLQSAAIHQKGRFFYSHYTDYLRFFVMYRFGGTYLDMDAILLRQLPDLEFAGLDDPNGECSWCFPGNMYVAPGVMRLLPNRKFCYDILETSFGPSYDPECFNCVGPKAFTTQLANIPEQDRLFMNLLPKHILYPLSYHQVHALFDGSLPQPDLYLKLLTRSSWSVHLFGHVTNKLPISDHSVVRALFSLLDMRLKIHSPSAHAGQNGRPLQLYAPEMIVFSSNEVSLIGPHCIYLSINVTR